MTSKLLTNSDYKILNDIIALRLRQINKEEPEWHKSLVMAERFSGAECSNNDLNRINSWITRDITDVTTIVPFITTPDDVYLLIISGTAHLDGTQIERCPYCIREYSEFPMILQ